MAIINVRVMTTAGELMLTGEVSSDRIPPEDLKRQGVKPDNLFAITGKDQVEFTLDDNVLANLINFSLKKTGFY